MILCTSGWVSYQGDIILAHNSPCPSIGPLRRSSVWRLRFLTWQWWQCLTRWQLLMSHIKMRSWRVLSNVSTGTKTQLLTFEMDKNNHSEPVVVLEKKTNNRPEQLRCTGVKPGVDEHEHFDSGVIPQLYIDWNNVTICSNLKIFSVQTIYQVELRPWPGEGERVPWLVDSWYQPTVALTAVITLLTSLTRPGR